LESTDKTSGVCRNASAEFCDRNQHGVLPFRKIPPHCCGNSAVVSRASSSGDGMKARKIAETKKSRK
jgi:hypothetical protein